MVIAQSGDLTSPHPTSSNLLLQTLQSPTQQQGSTDPRCLPDRTKQGSDPERAMTGSHAHMSATATTSPRMATTVGSRPWISGRHSIQYSTAAHGKPLRVLGVKPGHIATMQLRDRHRSHRHHLSPVFLRTRHQTNQLTVVRFSHTTHHCTPHRHMWRLPSRDPDKRMQR